MRLYVSISLRRVHMCAAFTSAFILFVPTWILGCPSTALSSGPLIGAAPIHRLIRNGLKGQFKTHLGFTCSYSTPEGQPVFNIMCWCPIAINACEHSSIRADMSAPAPAGWNCFSVWLPHLGTFQTAVPAPPRSVRQASSVLTGTLVLDVSCGSSSEVPGDLVVEDSRLWVQPSFPPFPVAIELFKVGI